MSKQKEQPANFIIEETKTPKNYLMKDLSITTDPALAMGFMTEKEANSFIVQNKLDPALYTVIPYPDKQEKS